MSTDYNLSALRELLEAAFNVSDLQTLAFDLFRPVYDDLPSAATKSAVIRTMIDYAERYGRIPHLLQYIQRENIYQYGRFAPQLRSQTPMTNPTPSYGYEQRLADLNRNIARELTLLQEYEELLDNTRDPRDRRRYQADIERQNDSLDKYRQQLAALEGEVQRTQQTISETQPTLTDVMSGIRTLQQQMQQTEDKLAAGQAQIRDELDYNTDRILRRIDLRHHDTVRKLIAEMDARHQAEVALLEDAAAQQQIAQREAQQLTLLVQQALFNLSDLPDAAYWADLLNTVNEYTTWEQKLKFTLPIVPGILEFESEMNVDVLPKLQELWRALVNKFRAP